MDVLDNPVWWALTGPQASFGMVRDSVARFHPDVSVFGAFDQQPDGRRWADLVELIGPGASVALTGPLGDPPPTWTVEFEAVGIQMTGERRDRSAASPSLDALGAEYQMTPLGPSDVPEMLALVEVARPGPFSIRTVELGGYRGVRHGGDLVAMAGLRMQPAGWSEISAVATHPDHRRQGLARVVVVAVADEITRRGSTPFLHTGADNTGAIALYESMGFVQRRQVRFMSVRAPVS